MHYLAVHAAAACVALVGAAALGQASLASRVANAPDGIVRLQYDSRPGVCGNGRDVIAFHDSYFSRYNESFGTWNDAHCVAGPLRVSLTVTHGQVSQLKAQVGGTWPETDARITDLGSVQPRDASALLFAQVPALESTSLRGRILLPAVLADDVPVDAPLLALARDAGRRDETRRQALHWLGLLGDERVVPALVGFAKLGANDEREGEREDKGLASTAVAALSFLRGGAGIPALIDLARNAPSETRRGAVFWLGQSGDPRAIRTLHSVIEDSKEDARIRAHAIFSLSHSDQTPASAVDYLRSVYARLDHEQLKDAVFQGMSEDRQRGGDWLLAKASDTHEPVSLRRKALFWAGQRDGTSTADILGVYRSADSRDLREHAIFVLSQRPDDASVNALIGIARSDDDSRMRAKALFWLAQKHDDRVTKLISDLLVK